MTFVNVILLAENNVDIQREGRTQLQNWSMGDVEGTGKFEASATSQKFKEIAAEWVKETFGWALSAIVIIRYLPTGDLHRHVSKQFLS